MIGNIYSNINLSQEDTILLHLINNNTICNKECNEIYGFKHLPSVIRYLRKRNIKITSEPRSGENRLGGRVYWVDYTLAPLKEQPPQVQEMIKNFKNNITARKEV